MGRKCQPYVAEAATKIILDPDLSSRQALELVGCPIRSEAIKRAVRRKKQSMEETIARKLDAKNERKRKRDDAKALQISKTTAPSGFVTPTARVVKTTRAKKKKERLTDPDSDPDRAYRVATTLYANEQERKMRGEKNTLSSRKVAEKIGNEFGVAISESTLRRKVNFEGLTNVGLKRRGRSHCSSK